VSEEFREILAEAIQGLKDPRVGFVTVTGVKVSSDLHVAWVYYTVLGDEKAKAGTRAALRSAAPHLSSAGGSGRGVLAALRIDQLWAGARR
jgi:ribosome-binding factor A